MSVDAHSIQGETLLGPPKELQVGDLFYRIGRDQNRDPICESRPALEPDTPFKAEVVDKLPSEVLRALGR